ncbi:Envelope glycoprotein [Cricetulus griseus]|uniref:Envelope glycoprotein n=1 Tax=Cricetulus griseus TaxID=10029 RepID=G3HQB1_CRIGR|nr:Envelope glycoprotein [Cricetulus griseus]
MGECQYLSLPDGDSEVAAGVGTRTAALVQGPQHYNELKTAINEDIKTIKGSINKLEKSLASLAEVALQNCRELDLLFLKEGRLYAALKEECFFYVNHSGVIRDSMAKLRERLNQRRKEQESQQGWFKG